MGFYSIFASVTGMLLVAMIAYMSYCSLVLKEKLTLKNTLILIVLSYGVALVECLLPIVGVGSFKYSGEGFCYIDWSDIGQAVCMELVAYPMFFITLYWLARCAMHKEEAETEGLEENSVQNKPGWWWTLLAASYISAWVLWLPAIFIGLDSSKRYPDMFPDGYMVTGGAMGHLQALLNPVLYGIMWRTWYQGTQPTAVTPEKPHTAMLKDQANDTAVVETMHSSEFVKSAESEADSRECCHTV